MEGFGIEKLLLTLGILLFMFGGKRIPEIGAALGGGIKAFKKGMHEDDAPAELPPTSAVVAPVEETREPKRLIG